MADNLTIKTGDLMVGFPILDKKLQQVHVDIEPGNYTIWGEIETYYKNKHNDYFDLYGFSDDLDIYFLIFDKFYEAEILSLLNQYWKKYYKMDAPCSYLNFVQKYLPLIEKKIKAKVTYLWLYEWYDQNETTLFLNKDSLTFEKK